MKIRAHTSAGTIDVEDLVLLDGRELRLTGKTHGLPTFQHLDGSGAVSIIGESFLRDALRNGGLTLQRGYFNAQRRERHARSGRV